MAEPVIIYRHNTSLFTIVLEEPDPGNPGQLRPTDLTGLQVVFRIVKTIKTVNSDVLSIVSGTPTDKGSSVTITDAVNGEVSVKLTDEEITFNFDVGYWWLQVVSGGDKFPRGSGPIEVREPYE